jgi:hypothetical protein
MPAPQHPWLSLTSPAWPLGPGGPHRRCDHARMDVELSEVRDFLARHAPFDVLPDEVLDGIPRQCTLRYARRGTVVLEVGQQGRGYTSCAPAPSTSSTRAAR